MFCSAPLRPWGFWVFGVCACVCVRACTCTCVCVPLMGGLGVVSRGLSRILSSRREGRKAKGWVGGTRLSQLAFGLPLGIGPPSTTLPWDFRRLIASLSLFLLTFSFALSQPLCFSTLPTLGCLYPHSFSFSCSK